VPTNAAVAQLVVSGCALLFWVWCLVDFSRTDPEEVRLFTRPVWIAVLVLGSAAGGLLWLGWGRPPRR
jgi:hypothetical protein